MEVSGQLHAPAALPPGKKPLVPIGYEAGWAPEPFRTWWWIKFPAPQGIEPETPDRRSRSLIAIPTEISRLLSKDGHTFSFPFYWAVDVLWRLLNYCLNYCGRYTDFIWSFIDTRVEVLEFYEGYLHYIKSFYVEMFINFFRTKMSGAF
jgi:hypothetical protein